MAWLRLSGIKKEGKRQMGNASSYVSFSGDNKSPFILYVPAFPLPKCCSVDSREHYIYSQACHHPL